MLCRLSYVRVKVPGGIELFASGPKAGKYARLESNQRPLPSQSSALPLSYERESTHTGAGFYGDANPRFFGMRPVSVIGIVGR